MAEYRRAVTYQSFMQLSPQQRKQHSSYFLQKNPQFCPVILNIQHGGKSVQLKMCKLLINLNRNMSEQQQKMRGYIIKHSHGIITAKDSIFFWYNKKFVDQALTVKQFLKYNFKDSQKDGWLHLKVTTQEAY